MLALMTAAELIGVVDGTDAARHPVEHGARRRGHAQRPARPRRRPRTTRSTGTSRRRGRSRVALPVDRAHFPAGRRLELTQARRAAHQLGRRQPPDLLRRVRRHVPAGVEQRLLGRRRSPGPRSSPTLDRRGWDDPPAADVDARRVTPKSAIELPPLDVPRARPRAPLPAARPAAKPRARRRPTRSAKDDDEGRQGASRACAASHRDPRRVPRRAAEGAAGAGQRPDVHDPRRPRRHRRLLPQPDVARPGPDHRARPGDRSRNGMLAYALFQDWGNDPLRYDSGPPASCCTRAVELFPAGAATGPGRRRRSSALSVAVRPRPAQRAARRRGGFRASSRRSTGTSRVDGPKHRVDRARQPHPAQLRARATARRATCPSTRRSTRSRSRRCPPAGRCSS